MRLDCFYPGEAESVYRVIFPILDIREREREREIIDHSITTHYDHVYASKQYIAPDQGPNAFKISKVQYSNV